MVAGQLSGSQPVLQATLTGVVIHKKPRFGPPDVTITFTVGAPGKPPGSGIPFGSSVFVLPYNRAGRPSSMAQAHGRDGRYSVTTNLPPGGIGGLMIGGWLNNRRGPPTARGGLWIPITISSAAS